MNLPRLAFFVAGLISSAAAADYHLTARYHIGGDASRWDYLRVDPQTHYLYAAHYTKFEVLNADTGEKVGTIGPASRAHGVVIVPSLHRGFATSGNDNAVIMFDSRTLQTLGIIKTGGSNPDAIQYDEADTKLVYAVNGASGSVTMIDPEAGKVVAIVPLVEGKLEQIAFDGRGHAFVNNEEKSSLHVFDTHARKALATWSLAPGDGGTGLAIDPDAHRTFSVCSNGKMVVLDSDTGKVVATPPIGDDPDGVVFDPKTKLIFSSNSDKTLTILHEDSPDSYSVAQTVPTDEGAKQLAIDPTTARIFLPAGRFGRAAKPNALPPVVPGTFDILVLSP
jgi:DNA-binding beta-propeller fold protein YncE